MSNCDSERLEAWAQNRGVSASAERVSFREPHSLDSRGERRLLSRAVVRYFPSLEEHVLFSALSPAMKSLEQVTVKAHHGLVGNANQRYW